MTEIGKYFPLILVFLLFFLLTVMPVTIKAQTYSSQTLGPINIISEGDIANYVKITSFENQSTLVNPVQLVLSARSSLLANRYNLTGDIGAVGYSLDSGPIYKVDITNQTIKHIGFTDELTVWAETSLPSLSAGTHNITVYNGHQFDRYDVIALASYYFTIISAEAATPMPTVSVPEFPRTASLIIVLSSLSILLLFTKRKQSIE